jgi:phosphoglycerate dehydrogenase-like enzyme
VLALPPLPEDVIRALFADLPVEVVVPAARTQEAARAVAADADIIVGDWSGLRVDADLVAAAPRLCLVQQPSVGVDAVDVETCAEAGVPVANAGGVNAVSVAEWCVGATLAVLRSLVFADREVRAGRWPQLELSARGGGELAGRRVGIVGMGRIGRECATRFVALGCDVAHYSRTPRNAEDAGGARWLPLEDLLAHAQVLVIVVALTPQTRGMLGTAQFRLVAGIIDNIRAAVGGEPVVDVVNGVDPVIRRREA